jgi:hypothetical protein
MSHNGDPLRPIPRATEAKQAKWGLRLLSADLDREGETVRRASCSGGEIRAALAPRCRPIAVMGPLAEFTPMAPNGDCRATPPPSRCSPTICSSGFAPPSRRPHHNPGRQRHVCDSARNPGYELVAQASAPTWTRARCSNLGRSRRSTRPWVRMSYGRSLHRVAGAANRDAPGVTRRVAPRGVRRGVFRNVLHGAVRLLRAKSSRMRR